MKRSILIILLVLMMFAAGCPKQENPTNPTPTIDSVNPNSCIQGETSSVTINGTYLSETTSVSFGLGITINSFTIDSSTQVTANITVDTAATTGSRDVSVTTPGGTDTMTGGFKVAPPAEIPEGILVDDIPQDADIIFTSIRYVLSDLDCLDENYDLKDRFITDPDCNCKIYTSGKLATPRQLFTMDLESGQVVQLTNNDCFFITAQVVDSTTIMALAACSDTDSNGLINEKDELELYLLDLETETMDCLTGDLELKAINNPDYSPVNEKIIFSAQQNGVFHNYLFTIDANKELEQITDDDGYMDFDCAWSEDGSKIVFNRILPPTPTFTEPSQVWLMNSDGTGAEKITDGGPNPDNEDNYGSYPIGTDADPDLSPDNSQIVFSRLKTAKQNEVFGVWELVVVDVDTKEETVLASQYANMVPEWKSGGIIFLRQQNVEDYMSHPMDIKQSLYRYKDGQFTELEDYPYNVFPIGSWGGSWIE